MGRIEKTVFVSYRRTNAPWALAIYQDLTQHGYDVFYDYKGIGSGNFESVILENIRARAHFLVLLTPSALQRCDEPGDWLRREIETALDSQRNIIPLMLEGFDFSTPAIVDQLRDKLAALKRYNALKVPVDYFSEAMKRLREGYLNVPLEAVLHPASGFALQAARDQQAALRTAPTVHDRELAAQQWYEQGVSADLKGDRDAALRGFNEAIRLEPDFADAHKMRGTVVRLAEEQAHREVEVARKAEEERKRVEVAHRAEEERKAAEEAEAKSKAEGVRKQQEVAAQQQAEVERRRRENEARRSAEEEALQRAPEEEQRKREAMPPRAQNEMQSVPETTKNNAPRTLTANGALLFLFLFAAGGALRSFRDVLANSHLATVDNYVSLFGGVGILSALAQPWQIFLGVSSVFITAGLIWMDFPIVSGLIISGFALCTDAFILLYMIFSSGPPRTSTGTGMSSMTSYDVTKMMMFGWSTLLIASINAAVFVYLLWVALQRRQPFYKK
jgi:hypothetical protein